MPEAQIRAGGIMAQTPDWYRARRGRCTASKRAETIATGSVRTWKTMLGEVEYELASDYQRDGYTNDAMQWGNDHEAQAIANLELEVGADVREPGFILHPSYSWAGATPDGFIDDDTTIQIKCPYNPQNHLKYIYQPELTGTYYYQVQWEAWTSQRQKIIFMSFDPRQPLATRCAIIRLDSSPEVWDKFDRRLSEFKQAVDGTVTREPVKLIETLGIPEFF